ncbi:MAG: Holliday junction branch migration protein RuvA [Sphingobacteriales bacterium]|nr:Holliday junction branch migration protein RuvA [Sphingobacteriales bacterium]
MYEYIKGQIISLTPAYVVIETGDIGYKINISLNTYEALTSLKECTLLLHLAIKEDAHILYGFSTAEERDLFRDLISVSGIGGGTAMVVLSSLKTNEIINAIISGNVSLLKSIKGIGPKTAQRMIVELQDSMKKTGKDLFSPLVFTDEVFDEAVSALVMLGYKKAEAEKSVTKIIRENKQKLTAEEIIKLSLKGL